MCQEMTINIGVQLFFIIYKGGIQLIENLGVTFNRSNSICLKALADTLTVPTEEPKETPTLFNFADIDCVEKLRKDLEDGSEPVESKLEAALRLIALDNESSSEANAPSVAVTCRMLRRDGVACSG
jgi:hypothetical protein